MAKYNVDITQNVQPASASPGSAARVEQARGAVIQGVLGAAGTAYDMYKESTLKDLQRAAEEEAMTFMQKNQEQSAMGAAAGAQMEQARKHAKAITMFDSVIPNDEIATITEQHQGLLQGHLYAANKFKEAYENGGMKPAEYMARVQGLVKSTIAKFPGMAGQIRKIVQQSTGLPFVDDASAAVQYTEQLFKDTNKPATKDTLGEHAAKQDLELITKYTGASAEEVLAMSRTGDPRYGFLLAKAKEAAGYEIASRNVDSRRKALEAQGGEDARRSASELLDVAGLGIMAKTGQYMMQNTKYLDEIRKTLSNPDTALGNSAAITTQLQALKGGMTTIINTETRNARQELLNMWNRGSIDKKTYDELKAQVEEKSKMWLENFDDNNLLGTASILTNHREKTLNEQLRIMSVNTEFMKLFGPSELVAKYLGGTEADRQEIKKIAPQLSNAIDTYIKPIAGALTASNSLVGNPMPLVGIALTEAKDNPNATPAPPVGTPDPKRAVRLSAEAVQVEANEAWKKLRKDPVGATQQQVNLLGTMMNNMSNYGVPNKELEKNWKGYAETFAKIPEQYSNPIKQSVALQHVSTSNALVEGLLSTDKSGVKLNIGVKPSGEIGVVPPMELFVPYNRASKGVTYDISKTTLYKDYAYMFADKVFKDEASYKMYLEYDRLATDWKNNYSVRANNMVLTRAIATGEQPRKIGEEYAFSINSRQPVQPFFNNAPVNMQQTTTAVQPTAQETTTPGNKWWLNE